MLRNVESKVYASAAGSGAGAVVSAFVLWLLGALLWGGSWASSDTASLVPDPVVAFVVLGLTVAGAAVGGYLADHTERTDLLDNTGPIAEEI